MTDYTPPEEMRAVLVERIARALCTKRWPTLDWDDTDSLAMMNRYDALHEAHVALAAIVPDLGELVGALNHLEKLHRRPVHAAWICTLCDEPNGHLEDCPFAVLSKWRQP